MGHRIMPATITLFGNGKADSKTLVLNAVNKHYPHLQSKYRKLFDEKGQLPRYYRNAFYKKMKELGDRYALPNGIA